MGNYRTTLWTDFEARVPLTRSISTGARRIVAGLRNRSETELYIKRILADMVSKLRWHAWHAPEKPGTNCGAS